MKILEIARLLRWACLFSLVIAGSAVGQITKGEDNPTPLPEKIIGEWIVVSVLVDHGTERTLLYQSNDHRLMGKIFDIGQGKLSSNTPESSACLSPQESALETTVDKLIQTSFPPHGLSGIRPSAKDYRFPVSGSTTIRVTSIICRAGDFGPPPLHTSLSSSDNTWIVRLPGQKLAIRWYDETILLLRSVRSK